MSLFQNKPKIDNLEEFRDIANDVMEGDFVPYACHWDPNTLVTKNGEVLQTIRITGFAQQMEGKSEGSSLRDKIREAVMQCIDSTKYALWIHTIRRKENLKTDGEYTRDFSGYLNHFWNDKNDWEHKFINEVYVTIVREGKSAGLFDMDVFLRGLVSSSNRHAFEGAIEQSCKELSKVTSKMLKVLSGYGAQLLGVVKRNDAYYSEVCEFLGKLTSLRDTEFPMQDIGIAHALTDYDVTFGYNAMEVRMRSDGKRRFGAILTLREYHDLAIDVLDMLLQVPVEFIISQSFEFVHSKTALQGYESQKELLSTGKAQVLYEKTGLKGLFDSNKGGKTDYGQHQINIFLLADSVKALENGVASTAKSLGNFGMVPMREDIKAEECYWAQLPGNFEFIKRMRPVNTARIGGFANLSNLPAGSKRDNHWGPAVTTLHTVARTPYFFNFHQGNNGHTAVISQTGAGGIVMLNFLLSEARKFHNKLFFFDMNRSSEIFLRSLGGEYYNPYPGADPRAYAQVTLNPFDLEDNERNRDFLNVWLGILAGSSAAPEFSGVYGQAIAATLALPKEQRHLRTCVDFMRQSNAAAADIFLPWTEGQLSGLFAHGRPDSFVLENTICGFEMGDIVTNKAAIIPVLSYILQRIEAVLDGSPAIIAMAEAWKLMDNDFFAPRIPVLLDYWQSQNAMAIFSTDQAWSVFHSSINPMLMEKLATQIYLPDNNADEAYNGAFDLSEHEIYYLSVMNTEDRHFLIKRNRETTVAELNLTGMQDIIAVLSATPTNLHIMEEAIEKNGTFHAKWMPVFLEMV